MGVLVSFLALVVLSFAIFGVISAIGAKTDQKKDFGSGSIWIALFFVVFFWISTPFYVEYAQMFFEPAAEDGQFGDQFGAVTSLFSGLAFVGLVWTLVLQRQELSLQRKELENTRLEFKLQRFEAALFSLIDLFNEHTERISFKTESDNEMTGRAALEYFASELEDEYAMANLLDEDGEEYTELLPTGRDLAEQILSYEINYSILFESELGPYFRLLYHCIRHIEHSDLQEHEKQRYSKIVRAYLGPSELKLLFFNCLTEKGKDFKRWVEKYELLKHVGDDARSLNPSIESQYLENAFGKG
jgi:hypothetical protein